MYEEQLNLFGNEKDSSSLRRRRFVTIPIDTLFLLLVVMVLLFALCYSFGVERGRKLAYLDKIKEENITVSSVSNTTFQRDFSSGINIQERIKDDTNHAALTVESSIPQTMPKQTALATERDGRYSIQVASYLTETSASQEAKRLEKKGFAVSVLRKGKFMVLFVGQFTDRREAEKNIELLRKDYRDCFIRRL